jgi:hypothetical protein
MSGGADEGSRIRGLRLFGLVLHGLAVLLLAISVAAVPLLALFLTGRGPIRVHAFIEPPYSIGLAENRVLFVGDERHVSGRVNFPIGEEARYFKEPPRVLAPVRVDPEDTDTRAVLSATAVALIALAGLGLVKLRGVVGSALRGDAFVPANRARLRWLAACVLSLPLVTWASSRVVQHTLEVDPAVAVVSYGPSPWTALVVGFGLLALAEVFQEGSVLRQFERDTV